MVSQGVRRVSRYSIHPYYPHATLYTTVTSLATALHNSTITPAPVRTCIHSRCVSLRRSFSDLTSANMTCFFSECQRKRSGMPPPRWRYSWASFVEEWD